jgi:hypothetical protein
MVIRTSAGKVEGHKKDYPQMTPIDADENRKRGLRRKNSLS